MVNNIQLSTDGAAIVVDEREIEGVCHFCGGTKEFAVPSVAANVPVYNKPQKWALIFGGTLRQPKRFFICNGCAKSICSK